MKQELTEHQKKYLEEYIPSDIRDKVKRVWEEDDELTRLRLVWGWVKEDVITFKEWSKMIPYTLGGTCVS